ncbi:hypothetical protein FACS1894105_14480 [Clostridia bacterium]|nr:hypothetical protein FACS1894105_14480 [Clostridia bacterium]
MRIIFMEHKRFKRNDSGFTCAECGASVPALVSSSRDHCPRCLTSFHVDVFPGDRLNTCKGKLTATGAEPLTDGRFIIRYKCVKCGADLRCKSARDDDSDLLIKLTAAET